MSEKKPYNSYKKVARTKKAAHIAVALAREGFGWDLVETFTPEQRLIAAKMAGQLKPSDETWEMVVEFLAA